MSLSHTSFLVLLVLGVALFGAGQLAVAWLMARLRPRLRALSRELELDWLGTGHRVLGRRPLVMVDARLLFSALPQPMAADAEIVVLIRRLRRWALLEYGFMFEFAAYLLLGRAEHRCAVPASAGYTGGPICRPSPCPIRPRFPCPKRWHRPCRRCPSTP